MAENAAIPEEETHEQRLARLGITDFENKVWCLIFSMRERGVIGDDLWWGQDFLGVQQMLTAKGLNCDPAKVTDGSRFSDRNR